MVGKFRGWHILAGIAAMVLTGIVGTAMGLNNTAAFMSSCVAFVAVAMWMDGRMSRRRQAAAREAAQAATDGAAGNPAAGETGRTPDTGLPLDAERTKRDKYGR